MPDFPNSPIVGQQFTAAGVTWTWDGAKWLPSGLSPTVVPGINDNRLINGDMRVDQRNSGASGTAQGYTADRWFYQATTAGKGAWQRFSTGSYPGFSYILGFTSTSAYTPLTGDAFDFQQRIEADAISDFAWGTANAQPVTLSFLVNSSFAGTFSGAITNLTNRSYPFTYTLVANVWTKISITIPGDTAGTWTMSGNAYGVVVIFDLGAGATYRGPANAWSSNLYVGATGAVSVVATNGATFYMTGVKLETGSVATPFNRQSLAKSMADCQRYYQVYPTVIISGYCTAGAAFYTQHNFQIMRAAPTATPGSITYGNASTLTINSIDPIDLRLNLVVTANGVGYASLPLYLNAEL